MEKYNTLKSFIRIVSSQPSLLQISQVGSRRELSLRLAIPRKMTFDNIYTQKTAKQQILQDLFNAQLEDPSYSIYAIINWQKDNLMMRGTTMPQGKGQQIGILDDVIEWIMKQGKYTIQLKVEEMDKKINITQLFMKEYVTTFENQFVVQSIQQYYKLSHFVLRDYSEAPLSITLNLNSNSASFKHISFIYYSLGDYNQHKKEAQQLLSNLIQPKHKGNLQHPSKVHVLINFSETSPRMVNIVHLLDIINSTKADKTLIEASKKEVQRLQNIYKRLVEKHKKIMAILNKCIDLQHAQIDKKSLLYLEYLPMADKPNDKLKLSNIKKIQNQQEIELLVKELSALESSIGATKQAHKLKIAQYQNELNAKMEEKKRVWQNYQEYKNPNVKFQSVNNPDSLFWKPVINKAEKDLDQNIESQGDSFCSKNALNSHKNLTKKYLLEANKAISNKEVKKTNRKWVVDNKKLQVSSNSRQQRIRQEQIMLQISKIFKLIAKQEDIIEQSMANSSHFLSNSLINQVKNRKSNLKVDMQIVEQCLCRQYDQNSYANQLNGQKAFAKFQSDLRLKASNTNTTIRQFDR